MPASPYEVPAEKLRRATQLEHLHFETTAEITYAREIIGQPRGIRAIEFGVDINSPGFNIYVLGPTGSGRTTAIKTFLEKRAAKGKPPMDWVYVYNFEVEHQPRAIELPSGMGAQLRDDMIGLIDVLRREIPNVLQAEEFATAAEKMDSDYGMRRGEVFDAISGEASEKAFTIARTPSGLAIVPLTPDGQLMEPDAYNALDAATRDPLEKTRLELEEKLENALRQVRKIDREHEESRSQLERGAAAFVLVQHIGDLREKYEGREEVLLYLNQVRDDVLNRLDNFKPEPEDPEANPSPQMLYPMHVSEDERFRRYQVNLLVDHSQTKGVPVIVEEFPSYSNLVGRIEGRVQMGALETDFMGIKAGALHKANGGYLVLQARDVLSQPDAWDGLKRAVNAGVIRIEESALRTGLGVVIPQTIDPEPIPLNLKVVLLGSPSLYYALYNGDDEFHDLFKVKADFSSIMDRTPEAEMDYANFIAARCAEGNLPPFNRSAVRQVIEHASRRVGDQEKLSTLFGHITDLVQEAAYWASEEGADVVDAQHVIRALDEQRYRSDLYEERSLENIHREMIFIDTSGEVVGQVNGLSVVGLGDYEFGQPNRITARVYMGRDGVVAIEREVEMAGPIHNKGVYTLKGYLGGQYATSTHLALSASVTFEQNYSGVEGDSASAAELFALISAISGYPVKQNIAVTGSVNQLGRIQPIGGVNEKIEGFYNVCKARGLTGDQGVIIPCANLHNLMLETEVVEAVRAGKFHVYAIDSVDQGLELLTGVPAGDQNSDGTYPAGTVHYAAHKRLVEMAQSLRDWMRDTYNM